MQVSDPIVITRPLAQAASLATRVRLLGRQAVVFPLLDITPLADTAPLCAVLAELESFALIAFVSPNAIAAAFAARPSWPGGLQLAVIGEGSRAALASFGMDEGNARIVCPPNNGRTDSQTLLEALDTQQLRGRRVLIVRGESGRELLADALRSIGAQVTQVAAYRRTALDFDAARQTRLRELLEHGASWIVTSSEALRYLLAMAGNLDGPRAVAKLQRQQLIVPHHRIEETAHRLGFGKVLLTGSGDIALLAALQS